MISLALDKQQCRIVTVEFITYMLILQKQYLSDTRLARYKFMLEEFATLPELKDISERFNKAWPTDITWDQI